MAILKINKIKVDYVAVAAELSDDKVRCTPIAIKRRMEKLKKMIGDNSVSFVCSSSFIISDPCTDGSTGTRAIPASSANARPNSRSTTIQQHRASAGCQPRSWRRGSHARRSSNRDQGYRIRGLGKASPRHKQKSAANRRGMKRQTVRDGSWGGLPLAYNRTTACFMS